jgi:Mn2+/Fe2+ NRAMP family transporter
MNNMHTSTQAAQRPGLPYRQLRALEWLALALLAYAAIVVVHKLPWLRLLNEALPKLSWQTMYITAVVAVFGTAVIPYVFFWRNTPETRQLR